jgi:flagellar M-ring protein FliF
VQQLHVALILDKSVAAQAAQIQAAVAGAVGLTPKRGDTITRALVAFPKYAPPKAGPVPVSLIGPIKLGLLGLGALLFAFFTWRFMRKRESEELGDPAWLREITEPVRLSELEAGAPTREMVAVGPRAGVRQDDSIGRLDELMEREPSRVAAQVRTWMNED